MALPPNTVTNAPPAANLNSRPLDSRKITKHELTERLFMNGPTLSLHWVDSQGLRHQGTLLALQREDGSGSSFNVTIYTRGGTTEKFHLRTLD